MCILDDFQQALTALKAQSGWKSFKVLGIVTMVPVTLNQYSTIQALYADLTVVCSFTVCEHDLTMDALLENGVGDTDIKCCYHSRQNSFRSFSNNA